MIELNLMPELLAISFLQWRFKRFLNIVHDMDPIHQKTKSFLKTFNFSNNPSIGLNENIKELVSVWCNSKLSSPKYGCISS